MPSTTPSNLDIDRQLGLLPISDAEFEAIRKLVYDNVGIALTDQKRSLVVGRLQRLLKARRFDTFSEYLNYLKQDASGRGMDELVNSISTNHTFFYREKAHFDFFGQTVLPYMTRKLREKGKNDLRIWCAGCSSGEEPYTLVMLMMEHMGVDYASWKAGALATDISARALGTARAAVYPEDRLKLLPTAWRHKYFKTTEDGEYQVIERVRREVVFRRFNLMNQQFPFKSKFHAIFCRNVMIYFDSPTRKALVKRYYDFTEPGGYLFIGHSESLGRDECPYDYVMPAVYRKKEA